MKSFVQSKLPIHWNAPLGYFPKSGIYVDYPFPSEFNNAEFRNWLIHYFKQEIMTEDEREQYSSRPINESIGRYESWYENQIDIKSKPKTLDSDNVRVKNIVHQITTGLKVGGYNSILTNLCESVKKYMKNKNIVDETRFNDSNIKDIAIQQILEHDFLVPLYQKFLKDTSIKKGGKHIKNITKKRVRVNKSKSLRKKRKKF